MNLSRIDLNLLVVFDTIYSEGSITAAAEQLHLSQSAVSHALGRLRTLFDDPLFERQGQTIVPTPLARRRIEPVRAALRSLDAALDEPRRFDPAAAQRSFTIASRASFETMLFPAIAAGLLATAPTLDARLVSIERSSLEADLQAGRIDVAVDVLLPLQHDLRHAPLLQEPLVVVARRDHPVLRGTLALAQYLAADHVQVTGRRSGPGLEDLSLSRQGVTRRVRLRCQSFATACHTVAHTDFICTLPGRHARLASASLALQILPLPPQLSDTTLELFLYWHPNCDDDPANLWLRGYLHDMLHSTGLDPS